MKVDGKFVDGVKDLVVFYADDDRDDLDTFVDVMDDLLRGSDVYTHDGGEKLLHALRNPPPTPGIIFLDLNMPGMSGYDVLKEIKESEELKNYPVVVLSTSSDEKTIANCHLLGANYYIPKANDYFLLKDSIDYALRMDWSTFIPDINEFVYKYN